MTSRTVFELWLVCSLDDICEFICQINITELNETLNNLCFLLVLSAKSTYCQKHLQQSAREREFRKNLSLKKKKKVNLLAGNLQTFPPCSSLLILITER